MYARSTPMAERFQGLPPQQIFLDIYKTCDKVPWDISRPQPDVIKSFENGLFVGEVLDVGCGLGDNAIFLASKGLKVRAVDLSPDAVQHSKERLTRAGPPASSNLEIEQANALRLHETLGDRKFQTILDSALLHCFDDDNKKQYVASLTPHVLPGGRLVLLTFSDQNKDPWKGPDRVSKETLHQLFNANSGWNIESIESIEYDTNTRGKTGDYKFGTGWAYLLVATRN